MKSLLKINVYKTISTKVTHTYKIAQGILHLLKSPLVVDESKGIDKCLPPLPMDCCVTRFNFSPLSPIKIMVYNN